MKNEYRFFVLMFLVVTSVCAIDVNFTEKSENPSPEMLWRFPQLKTTASGDECWPDTGFEVMVEDRYYDGSLHKLASNAEEFGKLLTLLESSWIPVDVILPEDGGTALHHAVTADLYEHCLLLIMFGADPFIKDKAAKRPIDYCQPTEVGARIRVVLEIISAGLGRWLVSSASAVSVGMRVSAMALAVHVHPEYRRMFELIETARKENRPMCAPS